MKENSDKTTEEKGDVGQATKKQNAFVGFLADILRGVAIGVAFIIPGFSGGSVAAILGIYEKLVNAIADIFKHFKSSIRILVPILLGMLLGIAALIFPIQWGLKTYPIPTVSLFVGLALGGLPSVTEKLRGAKCNVTHIFAGLIPLALCIGLCFLPNAGEVDLFSLNAGGYLLLILIGVVGSCALVVPGISGSMLLLIFGYYNPIVSLVTNQLLHGQQIGVCILVLLLLALGIVGGFFGISVLMKFFLKKFPHGTYFAIVGFIVGSLPAVYVSTVRSTDAALSALYYSPGYWICTVLMLIIGIAISLALIIYAKKKQIN